MFILHSSSADFQSMWRAVAVDTLDEHKIEEYLNKQGITSMEASGYKRVVSH